MTTRYVGKGGDNGNSGLTWALRKLTLNGAEDTPVAAGDTVYVGAGTYREELICDVSGTSGSPITYIGDYGGSNTDGVGGVVRITGSDDDIIATRDDCVYIPEKNYRTFIGFKTDLSIATYGAFTSYTSCANLIIDRCYIGATLGDGIFISQPGTDIQIKNCYIQAGYYATASKKGIRIFYTTPIDDRSIVIENCIINSAESAIDISKIGGITVRNSLLFGADQGIFISAALTEGQVVTVNNNIFFSLYKALVAQSVGEIVEDYNSFYKCQYARVNVDTGANSNTYPPLFDSRWFFEMVK